MSKCLVLELFIQRARRCQKCQRFGHISRICCFPDSNFVCVRCEKNLFTHAEKCIIDKPNCINCKRNKLLALEASSTYSVLFSSSKRKFKKSWHIITFRKLRLKLFWTGKDLNLPGWTRLPLASFFA